MQSAKQLRHVQDMHSSPMEMQPSVRAQKETQKPNSVSLSALFSHYKVSPEAAAACETHNKEMLRGATHTPRAKEMRPELSIRAYIQIQLS